MEQKLAILASEVIGGTKGLELFVTPLLTSISSEPNTPITEQLFLQLFIAFPILIGVLVALVAGQQFIITLFDKRDDPNSDSDLE